ncbi:macro domain-containing protein [Actinomyces sp. MRS3W]|uniref:macro domain-containing protein n=1 Tax=Actinomyces sp. MRS3W TaxID=2800796 RepID=UPI0028FD79A8|nr:macro domain-containing protein [Actinomyces sp. MRS3W]MDU0349674.1 macro domain-containing protein [Actinomyces sp. MRS3W]
MSHVPSADVARLRRLTRHFATEAVQAGDVAAFPPPAALAELPPVELRRLLDGLLTIRPPREIPDDDVREDLDEMLAAEASKRVHDAGAPDALTLPTLAITHGVTGALGEHVALWRGDLTTLRAGAIVNAANAQMLGCRVPGHACIDNVIHAVAGPGLRAECAAYMDSRSGTPEHTGRALLTGGYHLPAAHVIHTVGPIVEDGRPTAEQRDQLASSYRSVLDTAERAGLDSVGLCSVSTGAFGYPKDEAAPLVLRVLTDWLAAHPDSTLRIVICAFADADVAAYEAAIAALPTSA